MTLLFLYVLITGCSAPQVNQEQVNITIIVDNTEIKTNQPIGSTVRDAIKSANVSLGELDQVTPSLSNIIQDSISIKVTRVREEFYDSKQVIPFEHQEIRSEMLPVGERRLSQAGKNGWEEITFHRVFEDGMIVSNNIYDTNVLSTPQPEVEIIGNLSTFAELEFPGKIAYLSAGNAWIIEENTSNRELAVPTGDLDGRIFFLSPDGKYLLFTRSSNEENTINSLWIAVLEEFPAKLIDLGVKNVIHFARFNPPSNKIAYSTVNWREASPGWIANNDLIILSISDSGDIISQTIAIEANAGGLYGWWGIDYSWSPDSDQLIYTLPDGIGIINLTDAAISPIHEIDAYQTGGNWAWLPGSAWSPDGKIIYSIDHSNSSPMESSENFNLLAISLYNGTSIHLAKDVGMFASPVPSPSRISDILLNGMQEISSSQSDYSIAYLQAVFPKNSVESDYRLFVIDRDGSNPKLLFPAIGAVGIKPQRVLWSPKPINSQGEFMIAFTYNGNIWLVNSVSGMAQQVTGDGLTNLLDWR